MASGRPRHLGSLDAVPLERAKITLTIRSDGSSRALDVFGGASKSAADHDVVLLARPLPTKMVRASCVVSSSSIPIFAYRVDGPLWTDSSALTSAALGEHVVVLGKHEASWEGIFLYSDEQIIVTYNAKTMEATMIDRKHILSVSIKNVPMGEAAHYSGANVCQLHAKARGFAVGKQHTVKLAYDFVHGALRFSAHHVASFDPIEEKMKLSSFVEIENSSGVHLMNAIVRIRQRRGDSERQEEEKTEERFSPRRVSQHKRHEEAVMMAAPSALPQALEVAPISLGAHEATIDAALNDDGSLIHLAPGSRTKIRALEADGIPAKLRYVTRMNYPCSPGSATLDWNTYENSVRVLSFLAADVSAAAPEHSLLSGFVLAQDSRNGDEPLSDHPCVLNAWQNVETGRMRIDLGTNAGIRWRAYVEREIDDPKKSISTKTCRVDIIVVPGQKPGKVFIKFEAKLSQQRVVPEFLGLYRRLPYPKKPEEDDSAMIAPNILEETGDRFAPRWTLERKDLKFSAHDSESDDAPVDHSRADLALQVDVADADVFSYRRLHLPVLVSAYYRVVYTL